ncbi:MAG: hypothetical protein AAB262_15545, partial [Elusimicrobiota bacterium]
MKQFCAVLVLTLLAAVPAAASAKRYLVGFREGTTPAQQAAALKILGATEVDDIAEIGAIVAEISGGAQSFQAFEAQAQFLPEVLEVQEDIYRKWLLDSPSFQTTPFPSLGAIRAALPRFPKAAARPVYPLPDGVDAAEVPWGIARVDAPAAWAVTKGEGVK